jgi:hypothetical protein
MARSKPTRSIELTYAKVRQTNDEGTLFPCFIGPRYILHRLEQNNTFSGMFVTGTEVTEFMYPMQAVDVITTIDTAKVNVKLANAVVQVASNLSVTAHATAKNCIIFTEAVAGDNKSAALAGYDVKIGDIIEVAGTDAIITDIRKNDAGLYTEVYVNTSGFTLSEGTTVSIYTASIATSPVAVDPAKFSISTNGIKFASNTIEININKKVYNVKSAEVHIEYRELITEGAFELVSGDAENLADFVGVADPDNPLGFFAYCAQLAETTAFYVMAIPEDTYNNYEKALNIALHYENVFAPITYNQSEAICAHLIALMNTYNDPSIAQFKKLWFVDDTASQSPVYTATSDAQELQITIADNGVVTFSVGDIVSAGVRIGDILVIPAYYDVDLQKYIRKEYVIESIIDTDSLTIRNADITIDTNVKAFVARNLSNIEYANAVGDKAYKLNSPYINYVWADNPVCLGYGQVNPVFLSATLAALRSKNAPHAPLSEVSIPGWSVSDTHGLSEYELDIMNNKGVWIVYKDRYGEVVTRHQLTTVQDGTLAEEDSAVSNACNIVRSLRSMLYQYRGDSNVTTELIDALNADIRQSLDRIMSRIYPIRLGKQVIDYSVKNLKIDDDNRARIILDVDIDVPEPLLDGHFKFNII